MATANQPRARAGRTSSASSDAGDSVSRRTLDVIVNVVTAYQRLHLRLDDRDLVIDTPEAWLGVLPHGRRVIHVSRREIVDWRIAPAVFPSRLGVAVGLAVLPWLVTVPAVLAAACGIAAVLFLLLAVVASIRIETRDGARHVVPVCWLQRRVVRSFLAPLQEDEP